MLDGNQKASYNPDTITADQELLFGIYNAIIELKNAVKKTVVTEDDLKIYLDLLKKEGIL